MLPRQAHTAHAWNEARIGQYGQKTHPYGRMDSEKGPADRNIRRRDTHGNPVGDAWPYIAADALNHGRMDGGPRKPGVGGTPLLENPSVDGNVISYGLMGGSWAWRPLDRAAALMQGLGSAQAQSQGHVNAQGPYGPMDSVQQPGTRTAGAQHGEAIHWQPASGGN